METSNYINNINVAPSDNHIQSSTDNKNTVTPDSQIKQFTLYRVRENRDNYIIVSKSSNLNLQSTFKGKLVINLGTLIPDDNHKVEISIMNLFKDADYIKINKISSSASNSSLQTLLVHLLTGKSKYKFVQVGDTKSNTYVLKK